MPKYKCKISSHVEYEIDVDADDEDAAEAIALDLVDPSSHWVDERDMECWSIQEVK